MRISPWPLALGVIALTGAAFFVHDVATDGDATARSADPFDQIDAYVASELNDAPIPGLALAIVDRGEIVHAAGFGDDGHGNAVTPETPFWIGSNTKSITALAVMQLVQAGRVDLDTPIQTYLPEFDLADHEAATTITVRHLLNQTSGLSRHDGLRAVLDTGERSLRDVVADMATLRTNRPVGSTLEYSNLNSVVLGRLVEVVTGQSWEDYVQAKIFAPAGMDHTYTDQVAAEAAGLTATYRTAFGRPVETGWDHTEGLAPSGFVYSTAADMARYLSIYTGEGSVGSAQIIDPDGIATMLSGATNERTVVLQGTSFTARYGAGWFVGPFGAAPDARWHQGSLPHFTAWMVLLPDTEQGVIVLMNAGSQFEIAGANQTWSRIPQGVVNLLRGEQPPTGMATDRFFIVFDTIAVLGLTLQAWSLARVLARRADPWRGASSVAALAWELPIAGTLLVGFPGVAGGLGWQGALRFVPDLGVTVLAIAGLGVITGVVRAALLVRHLSAARSASHPHRLGDLARLTQWPATSRSPTCTPGRCGSPQL